VSAGRWHRDVWSDAVWDSSLLPLQKLIALAYADHARDGELAWVTYDRLRERTGLSRDAVARHLRALVDAGWLVLVSAASQHRSARYRLAIPSPSVQQSVPRTTERFQQSVSQTADVVQRSVSAVQQSVSKAPAVRETDSTSVPTSLPTSSPVTRGNLRPTLVSAEVEEDDEQQKTRTAENALRAAVPVAATLTSEARKSLAVCVRRGWTSDALVQAVANPSWEGSTHPPGLLAKRLLNCAQQTPPRPAQVRPPWCTQCDERTRMIDDDRPARCPNCHPLSVRRAKRGQEISEMSDMGHGPSRVWPVAA
jgi:DNA-binding transcriptional ArsR family regulator